MIKKEVIIVSLLLILALVFLLSDYFKPEPEILPSPGGDLAANHEFIFIAARNTFSPEFWEEAASLNNSCLNISFRLQEAPGNFTGLEKSINEMESRNYKYYLTAGSSDFTQKPYNYSALFWNASDICPYLSNENAKGFYFHETMIYCNSGKHNDPADEEYDCGSFHEQYKTVNALLECAKNNNKKVLWSDAGYGWAWGWMENEINNNDTWKQLFLDYGNVIVPMWANNRNTSDPVFEQKILNSIESVKNISNQYCQGKRGASVQAWHWRATTGEKTCEVPWWDIFNYTRLNYDEGGSYTQYEGLWDFSKDPCNKGEYTFAETEFYKGVINSRDYICSGVVCSDEKCEEPETSETCPQDCFWEEDTDGNGCVDSVESENYTQNWLNDLGEITQVEATHSRDRWLRGISSC